jgi:hypothetical protein
MYPIRSCELPANSLLRRYRNGAAYTDCYTTEIKGAVSHSAYVEAFYTSVLFKLERFLLSWLVARPSTDVEAYELAAGKRDAFAAWNMEGRDTNQLLLSDFQGRTRSWLMCTPAEKGRSTQLYFGSAVVPVIDRRTGEQKMGLAFRVLLGFHRIYSRALLRAAVSRLSRKGGGGSSEL